MVAPNAHIHNPWIAIHNGSQNLFDRFAIYDLLIICNFNENNLS